jgi:hypothetical protein
LQSFIDFSGVTLQKDVCKCDVNEGLKDRFFGATEGDEGRPLGVGRQRQASNQAVRLKFKRLRS